MAVVDRVRTVSVPASADHSANQFRFMKLSSGLAALCGDGEASIGVLQNKPSAANQPAAIAPIDGSIVKVVAGAAVSVDAKVCSDASGRAVATATGKHHLGMALEAASGAGVIFKVMLVSQNII